MQLCEGLRPDVTAINLSLLTYTWSAHKRHLYNTTNTGTTSSTGTTSTEGGPGLSFPGTHHVAPNSVSAYRKEGYTFRALLEANSGTIGYIALVCFAYICYAIFCPYITDWLYNSCIYTLIMHYIGKLNYPDPTLEKEYEVIPLGLVTQYIHKSKAPNGTLYNKLSMKSLRKVLNILPVDSLPSGQNYDPSTWEWTIGRDFKDKITGIYTMTYTHMCNIYCITPTVYSIQMQYILTIPTRTRLTYTYIICYMYHIIPIIYGCNTFSQYLHIYVQYILAEVAAYALETAIAVAHKDPLPLVYACYLLETAIYLEQTEYYNNSNNNNANSSNMALYNNVPSGLLKVSIQFISS